MAYTSHSHVVYAILHNAFYTLLNHQMPVHDLSPCILPLPSCILYVSLYISYSLFIFLCIFIFLQSFYLSLHFLTVFYLSLYFLTVFPFFPYIFFTTTIICPGSTSPFKSLTSVKQSTVV